MKQKTVCKWTLIRAVKHTVASVEETLCCESDWLLTPQSSSDLTKKEMIRAETKEAVQQQWGPHSWALSCLFPDSTTLFRFGQFIDLNQLIHVLLVAAFLTLVSFPSTCSTNFKRFTFIYQWDTIKCGKNMNNCIYVCLMYLALKSLEYGIRQLCTIIVIHHHMIIRVNLQCEPWTQMYKSTFSDCM